MALYDEMLNFNTEHAVYEIKVKVTLAQLDADFPRATAQALGEIVSAALMDAEDSALHLVSAEIAVDSIGYQKPSNPQGRKPRRKP